MRSIAEGILCLKLGESVYEKEVSENLALQLSSNSVIRLLLFLLCSETHCSAQGYILHTLSVVTAAYLASA